MTRKVWVHHSGQQTQEQLREARKILENIQLSERKKQQLEFQHQQLKLSLEQTKAAHAMEQQLQSIQLQEVEQTSRSRPIKLVLRKRFLYWNFTSCVVRKLSSFAELKITNLRTLNLTIFLEMVHNYLWGKGFSRVEHVCSGEPNFVYPL